MQRKPARNNYLTGQLDVALNQMRGVGKGSKKGGEGSNLLLYFSSCYYDRIL